MAKVKSNCETTCILLFLRLFNGKIVRMRPIQMVDLKQQYQKLKKEIDGAVLKVLDSSAFINGPQVQSFASALANYHGVKHVIPCANGRVLP